MVKYLVYGNLPDNVEVFPGGEYLVLSAGKVGDHVLRPQEVTPGPVACVEVLIGNDTETRQREIDMRRYLTSQRRHKRPKHCTEKSSLPLFLSLSLSLLHSLVHTADTPATHLPDVLLVHVFRLLDHELPCTRVGGSTDKNKTYAYATATVNRDKKRKLRNHARETGARNGRRQSMNLGRAVGNRFVPVPKRGMTKNMACIGQLRTRRISRALQHETHTFFSWCL